MNTKKIGKLAAGLLAASLVATEALAQQGVGQTGGTGQSGGNVTPGAISSQPGAITSSAQGMNLPTVNATNTPGMTTGTGATQGASTSRSGRSTGRTTRGRTQSTLRTAPMTGARGGMGQNALNNQRRDSRLRAQYSMQIESVAMSLEPRATLELRDTVQESITASVPGGVRVAVEGTEVVLTGAVPSDTDRRLAELMASLEPGVRSVRNELVVEKPAK